MPLLDRIRRGTYVPDGDPPLVAPGRSTSAAEAASRILAGEDVLAAVRDLLGQAGRATAAELGGMISARPEPLGRPEVDALLAGIAEHLATTHELPVPEWTQEPERFLDRFWFVSHEPGFRAAALAQTPVALKRRGIFWPSRSLSRV